MVYSSRLLQAVQAFLFLGDAYLELLVLLEARRMSSMVAPLPHFSLKNLTSKAAANLCTAALVWKAGSAASYLGPTEGSRVLLW